MTESDERTDAGLYKKSNVYTRTNHKNISIATLCDLIGSGRESQFRMALQTNSVDKFAKKVVCLCIHGCVIAVGLELLNDGQLISNLTKSGTRCGVWAVLAVYFVHQLHTTFRSRSALTADTIFAIVTTFGLALAVCEDIPSFNPIPIIGRHGPLHSLSFKISLCI